MKFPFWSADEAQLKAENPFNVVPSPHLGTSASEENPLASIESFDNYQRKILKQFMQLQAVEAHHSAKTGMTAGTYPMSDAWNRVQHGLQYGADPYGMAIMAHQQHIRQMRQMQMANRAGAQGGVGSLAGNVEQLAVHH